MPLTFLHTPTLTMYTKLGRSTPGPYGAVTSDSKTWSIVMAQLHTSHPKPSFFLSFPGRIFSGGLRSCTITVKFKASGLYAQLCKFLSERRCSNLLPVIIKGFCHCSKKVNFQQTTVVDILRRCCSGTISCPNTPKSMHCCTHMKK